ncbi:conserved hypothetical protein [Pediculus humanus corporis]|uniref:Ragulator complex protein LAMTOR1 n=1 Tax=Pediculus humanus subsp. corporis TaxID=121224 RepID=E0V989_PEDHC|nr:uncharacterized protein Phum_PHUM005960 [Pediculus humanus corporis]EEB09945.1 conserved hypothetical protein [Pediculus humanus corporis]
MGACTSCCDSEESGTGGEPNERTHLLVDPVSNTPNNLHRVHSDEFVPGYNNLLPKNDELSALTKILNETANSVIDVSALDSHDLEQHEYYERMKAYKARLNGLVKWSPPYQYKNLLTEVPVPEKVLASEPISEANLLMITNTVKKLTEALSSVCVEHKEDLVVPFRIP